LAKNFNLKVKNSQLAAVLKQKGLNSLKGNESELEKTPPIAKEVEAKDGDDAEKKVQRKAKSGPTMAPVQEALPSEELITSELTEDPFVSETIVTSEEEVKAISVEESIPALTIKDEGLTQIEEPAQINKVTSYEPSSFSAKADFIKETKLSDAEIRKREIAKPIEERRILPKDKYARPERVTKPSIYNPNNKPTPKPYSPNKPTIDRNSVVIPPKSPPKALPVSADKKNIKVEEKKKKGMDSYKRQAFSRVFDSRDAISSEESWKRRRNKKNKTFVPSEDIVRPKSISVKIPISVKELASELKIKASEVIQKLFLAGFPITINDILEDITTIELIGNEFDCEIKIDTALADRLQITDRTLKEEIKDTGEEKLEKRPPIVTVMGHVDHGKTSIIDAFRNSNLAAAEAGAITQHIGAFVCHTDHGSFSVIDTPGHEAFTAIRARGATVTDIIVLVIAGDEGIKTQTDEAIDKAKAAGVPILVAINKVDKPGFNAENIYRQLADRDLLPEAWGGSVITVNCSAKTREGISTLAEMIALQTEILELRSNPNARARGTVLESELHKGLGVTATLLVLNGTLKVGDAVVFEHEWGKTKTMQNEFGQIVHSAPPSTPVKVTGLSGVPPAGNEFIVVASEKEAREIVAKRMSAHRQMKLNQAKNRVALSILEQRVEDMKKKTINIMVKADVGGSLEALKDSLLKIPTDKVIINIVSAEVGQISESDIDLAYASKSIILGFHTKVEPHAEGMIKQKKVKIILKDIIYHMIDEVKVEMQKLLDKVRHEDHVATAKVLTVFRSSRHGNIAGSIITEGLFKRSYMAKLKRDGKIIFEGPIHSLKRMQDDVKEVKKDTECGILLNGFNDFKENDEILGYEITYLEQQL